MPRKPATPRQAEVVALAEVIGIRPAARQAGIPESTLRTWREHPDLAQLRAETSAEVAQDVWAGFQRGVHRIVALLDTAEDLAKVAIATGVLFDKYALMTGQATARSEHRSLTDDIPDSERARLRDWIMALPAGADQEPAPN